MDWLAFLLFGSWMFTLGILVGLIIFLRKIISYIALVVSKMEGKDISATKVYSWIKEFLDLYGERFKKED